MAGRWQSIALVLCAGCVCSVSLQIQGQTTMPARTCPVKFVYSAHAPVGSQIPTKIDSVSFEGNIHLPGSEQEQIADSLKQRTYHSDERLIELRNLVGDYTRMAWQNRGYFKVQVKDVQASTLNVGLTDQHAAVTMQVEEGPLYRLGDIRFKNERAFSSERLRALFPIQGGDVFDVDKVRAGLYGLRKLYGTVGHINFTSVPDTQIDEANGTISLVLDVDEGKQFRVGSVNIIGLPAGAEDSLLRSLPLRSGDFYNPQVMRQFLTVNKAALPAGSSEERNLLHRVDEADGTVAITLDFRPCP